MKNIFALILFVLITIPVNSQTFEIEGHRGARGLLPENTIPSFLKALEYGVGTLELDVVITKDNQVLVSHEPWFSSIISLDPQGKPIPADKQKEFNIYKMTYAETKRYDVGSLGNKDFPEQQKMKVFKPLLRDVFKEVGIYVKKHKLKPVRFNVEIKAGLEGDNIYHPIPSVFAKFVYDEIKAYKMENNVIVQSFDVRPLQELRKISPKLPLALLVGNKDGIEKNLEKLGFLPDTYSPHFSLVDEATVKYCRQKGLKIIPWTINEIADMERMKTFNLDGIITDYPDRAVKVFRK